MLACGRFLADKRYLFLHQHFLPLGIGLIVSNQGINVLQVTGLYEGGFIEFGMVKQQQGFFGLLEHDLFDYGLVLVGFHHAKLLV